MGVLERDIVGNEVTIMKYGKFKSFLIVAVILALSVLLYLYLREHAGRRWSANEGSRTDNLDAQSEVHSLSKSSSEQTSSNAITTDRLSTFTKVLSGRNIPVNFFGKVVDQNGKPLPGVAIKVLVRHIIMPSPITPLGGTESVSLELETQYDGCFEMKDISGDAFEFKSFMKNGFEIEPKTKKSYTPIQGNKANPTMFRMWATTVHESLIIKDNKKFPIIPDGRAYIIDLHTGEISTNGATGVRIWINRPPKVRFEDKFEWTCAIDVLNGELRMEDDNNSSMFVAPTEGYEKAFQFAQKVGSGWCDGTGKLRFYVSLNNGAEYGRMIVQLYAYFNEQVPGLIRISYVINPSGSHILK